jgi:ABC-2 type transport system permease protein
LSHVLRDTWALTMSRMRLAMRNRAFLFFSLIMPLAFLFIYMGIFGRGKVQAVPYLLAEVLALTVMGSFWGLSVQLVTFREQGILRRFRVTPVGASAMLASSLLSNYVLTLPTVAIEFYLSRQVFNMAGLGDILSIFVLVTVGTVTFASLGLIVASVTNTMQETQIINQIIWFVFLFISGATIPFPMLPGIAQKVALFLPATYLVSGLQRVMSERNTGIMDLGVYLASLVGCALIAFVISAQLFRWEPEAKAPRRAKLLAASAIIPFLLLGIWENLNGDLRNHAMKDLQSIREPYSLERIEH